MRSVSAQMKRKAVVEVGVKAAVEAKIEAAVLTSTGTGAEAELNRKGGTKKVNGVERNLIEGVVVGFVRGKLIYKLSKIITIQFNVTFNTKILELGLGTNDRNQVIVTAVTNPVSSVQIRDVLTSIGNTCLLYKSIEYSTRSCI